MSSPSTISKGLGTTFKNSPSGISGIYSPSLKEKISKIQSINPPPSSLDSSLVDSPSAPLVTLTNYINSPSKGLGTTSRASPINSPSGIKDDSPSPPKLKISTIQSKNPSDSLSLVSPSVSPSLFYANDINSPSNGLGTKSVTISPSIPGMKDEDSPSPPKLKISNIQSIKPSLSLSLYYYSPSYSPSKYVLEAVYYLD
mmetsp:Transcript_8903/g.783  ORF Transcript_8903/g.783 Transcript_8903/m.783 type:complete len:199 (+) Transcript_8903:741-1337(+)